MSRETTFMKDGAAGVLLQKIDLHSSNKECKDTVKK